MRRIGSGQADEIFAREVHDDVAGTVVRAADGDLVRIEIDELVRDGVAAVVLG